jgi:hypothetical protein
MRQGLYDGYTAAAPAAQRLTSLQYLAGSLNGDLDDLCVPQLFNCSKVGLPPGLTGANG